MNRAGIRGRLYAAFIEAEVCRVGSLLNRWRTPDAPEAERMADVALAHRELICGGDLEFADWALEERGRAHDVLMRVAHRLGLGDPATAEDAMTQLEGWLES